MMRGISVKEFGGPEVCKVDANLAIPEPNDNQVCLYLIRDLYGLNKV